MIELEENLHYLENIKEFDAQREDSMCFGTKLTS